MRLAEFKAVTFDCYGTLIDWETGMIAALKPLTDRVAPMLGRDAILEAHARQESRQQFHDRDGRSESTVEGGEFTTFDATTDNKEARRNPREIQCLFAGDDLPAIDRKERQIRPG